MPMLIPVPVPISRSPGKPGDREVGKPRSREAVDGEGDHRIARRETTAPASTAIQASSSRAGRGSKTVTRDGEVSRSRIDVSLAAPSNVRRPAPSVPASPTLPTVIRGPPVAACGEGDSVSKRCRSVSSVPDPRTGTQADRNADRSAVTPAVDFNYNLSIKYFSLFVASNRVGNRRIDEPGADRTVISRTAVCELVSDRNGSDRGTTPAYSSGASRVTATAVLPASSTASRRIL